jgi:hypothetical protein
MSEWDETYRTGKVDCSRASQETQKPAYQILRVGHMQAFLESQALSDSMEEAVDTVACDSITCAWLEDGSVLRSKDSNSVSPPPPS